MKRSPMPPRRAPMPRGKGLAGGSALVRRQRLPVMSARRRAELPEHAAVRAELYARDGCCILRDHPELAGPCSGDPLTPHHLMKAWKGGPYTLDNLVTLCAGHNTWVEDNPPLARPAGLVVLNGETTADAWARMRARGLVAA